jgi:Carboxypeptidase regulatory-like domain
MKNNKTLPAVLTLVFLVLAGCGGGGDEFSLPPSTGPAGGGGGGGPAYDPSTATATITGNILFDGVAPTPGRINTAADPNCDPSVGLQSEQTLVTDDGKLENVFVYVNSGHEGVSYPVPTMPVLLDQHNCHYVPHAFTMMAGQPLLIRNSDPTTHNIHATPKLNMVINFAQPRQGLESTETFALAEYMPPIPIQCDVHRWMNAHAGVFDHPFHTTSGDTGTYSISVPPGTYEIRTWHEEYGEMSSTVTVADGETVELDFTYAG